MGDPLFWLGVSLALVACSLVAVLAALIPAVRELRRAARSVEKLADTLSRELPPTLEAIRLTGLEITDLTDEAGDSVKRAGRVIQEVDRSLDRAKQQTETARTTARSLAAGVKVAWRTWKRRERRDRSSLPKSRPPLDLPTEARRDRVRSPFPEPPSE